MLKKVIGITMGDPGGIGPEIIVKSLAQLSKDPAFYYVVYGSQKPFEKIESRLGLKLPFGPLKFIDITGEADLPPNPKKFFDPGKVSPLNGALAFAALKRAAEDARRGKIQAIVTAPLNKTAMKLHDPDFHGHTEYLAQTSGTKKFAMMFVSSRLKVTLATIHVPLSKVSALITQERVLEKIMLTHAFMKKYFKSKPRIAVCALNPHGRETGREEDAELVPAVKAAKKKGVRVLGPLSADQLFYDAYEGRFDAVISMYHDQALGPFKMIAFKEGVNVTLGLPYIRTSPDHGTAFDIAYQGKADPASFQSALTLAETLLARGA